VSALPRYVLLYAALYAAYGVASPFLPAFLSERGLPAEQLGLVLAAGTAVRLLASPAAGRIGDLTRSLRRVLVLSLALAAAAALAYLPVSGLPLLLAVYLWHAAALAPAGVLADALALRQRFEYGRARGTGSAAFIAGTLLAGQAVGAFGLAAILWLQAALLGGAALAARRVPEFKHRGAARPPAGALPALLRIAVFRNVVLASALILGSHAMHDAFAVIRWREAGIGPAASSVLWSEAVAAEVLVFFLLGPALVTRLTPRGAIALAAVAGVLRWTVMAWTANLAALALVQPLHGITFALLHLACMRLIARVVPAGLEGTAQAIYGTVGIGAMTALLTLLSGLLYAEAGATGFLVMAALCALALPLAWKLRP
jgi:PPP family 3-phenylpropionic acid transporter